MIKVGIIGATGYAGVELFRLLMGHKKVEITALSSVSFEGKDISEVYPSLKKAAQMTLTNQQDVIDKCEVIFSALPHGLSEELGLKCFEKGKIFIDIGADFRLESEQEFKDWYNQGFKYPKLHKESVYGLCELNRESIKGKKIIANPGCYPTGAALAVIPALKYGLINTNGIIIDAKSGVTGAGRGLTQNTHFPDCNEAFSPYKTANHRHTPEIEQTLGIVAKTPVKITFVPHLLPLNRGIISTVYADMKADFDKIYDSYEKFYKNERFIRLHKKGDTANLKDVRMSNYCDISLHHDRHTNKLIAVSAIDNMVKGAAGAAIQNMNLVCGFNEDEGLDIIPPAF